jgi:hypothetical protein
VQKKEIHPHPSLGIYAAKNLFELTSQFWQYPDWLKNEISSEFLIWPL